MPSGATSVHTSLSAMVAKRTLAKSQEVINKAMERLATGRRINRASDDPSGLIAADSLGARRVTLEEVIKKAEHAGAFLDTAEGSLSVIQDLLTELGGTVVSAANTGATSQGEREALQIEANSVVRAIEHIIGNTSFNGKKILAEGDGLMLEGVWLGVNRLDPSRMGRITAPPPENAPETPEGQAPPEPRTFGLLDIVTGGGLNLVDGDLELAQKSVEAAIATVSGMRSGIGSLQKYTLGHQMNVVRTEHEVTAAAESQIRDADFAQEVSNLARGQAMQQASMFALQAAQQQTRRALQLLG